MNDSQSGNPAIQSMRSGLSPVRAKVGGKDWKRAFGLREMGVYYALLLLIVILAILTAHMGKVNYLSIQNLTNVLYQSSLVAIMAAAITVILITGNFDLSVASVAALSAAILVGTCESLGFPAAIVLSLVVAMIAGLLNGLIVLGLGINAFIVTLGTLTAYRGLVLIYTDGRSLQISSMDIAVQMVSFEGQSLDVGIAIVVAGLALLVLAVVDFLRSNLFKPKHLGMGLGGIVLIVISWLSGLTVVVRVPVLMMGGLVAAIWFVLEYTTFGRKIYAVGGNPEAARLSGINVFAYRLGAFIFCSAAAGFAGVLFASRLRSVSPTALEGMELTVIASAILGGTSLFGGSGSVVKTVAGALLLYSLTNGFNMLNVSANYQGLIEGMVVVAAASIYAIGARKKR